MFPFSILITYVMALIGEISSKLLVGLVPFMPIGVKSWIESAVSALLFWFRWSVSSSFVLSFSCCVSYTMSSEIVGVESLSSVVGRGFEFLVVRAAPVWGGWWTFLVLTSLELVLLLQQLSPWAEFFSSLLLLFSSSSDTWKLSKHYENG